METARTNWVNATDTQDAAEAAVLKSPAELKSLIKNVTDRRGAVQLAADAEWPHTAEEHGGVRKEFALSSRRALAA